MASTRIQDVRFHSAVVNGMILKLIIKNMKRHTNCKKNHRSKLINKDIAVTVVVKDEFEKKSRGSSRLESVQRKLELFRSVALSILFIIGSALISAVTVRELSTEAMLIEVTELPKIVSEQGNLQETIELEIAARIKSFQVPQHSQKPFILDLAYLLQSENKLLALPELPASTQRLLIQHTRPVPTLVVSKLDPNIREIISYIGYLLKNDSNRLTISITGANEKSLYARIHLVKGDLDVTTSVTSKSVNDMLEVISRWSANQLIPQEMVIAQFQQDRTKSDLTFSSTLSIVEEVSSLSGQISNKPFYLTILGDIAFQKSSYSEAEAFYRAALSHAPGYKDLVTYRLSQALLVQGRSLEAMESMGIQNESDAPSVDYLARLSSIFLQITSPLEKQYLSNQCSIKKTCLSEEILLKLLANASSSSAIASNALGVLRYVDHDIENARQLFIDAIEMSPGYSSALNNLGVIFMKEGKVADALVMFQSAASANPESGIAQLNLGNSLESFGRFADAAKHFSYAVTMNRDNLVCHTCWALSLFNIGLFDEAISAIQSGLKQEPRNASLFLLSGQISHKLGCFQAAIEAFDAAANGADGLVNLSLVHKSRGRTFLSLGDSKNAISEFIEELDQLPLDGDALTEMQRRVAEIYTKGPSRLSLVLIDFHEIAEAAIINSELTAKDVSEYYVELAEAILWVKKPISALTIARKAVELDPKEWNSHFVLGRVYSALGKESLARAEFQLARSLGGQNDIALLQTWIRSLKKSGNLDGAESVIADFNLHSLTCKESLNHALPSIKSTSGVWGG